MATYSIGDLDRREILKMSVILGLASVASTRLAIAQMPVQRTQSKYLVLTIQ
jgi:protocatechuate 3,4-dioxygenase, beta subunit